jgi:hypothetical protein
MARIILNKHKAHKDSIKSDDFQHKGEIIISNEPQYEGIAIINNSGEVKHIDATKDFVRDYVKTAIAAAQLKNENGEPVDIEFLASKDWVISTALTEYATIEYVDDKIAKIVIPSIEGLASEKWVEDKGYLTEHQSLEDYATKDFVDDKVNEIEVPSVEGLASEEFVLNKIAEAQLSGGDVDLSGYATKSELKNVAAQIPSLEGYAKIEDIPSVEGLASEAWVEAKGYLTEHQSLEGYAKVEDIPSVEGLASEEFVTEKIAEIEFPELDGYLKIEDIEIYSITKDTADKMAQTITDLEERVYETVDTHVVMSTDEYAELLAKGEVKEGVFYALYEEPEE